MQKLSKFWKIRSNSKPLCRFFTFCKPNSHLLNPIYSSLSNFFQENSIPINSNLSTTFIELNIENLINNLIYFQQLGKDAFGKNSKIWPVVKANAYGLDLQICSAVLIEVSKQLFKEPSTLCVHRAEEAFQLFSLFGKKVDNIVVLSPPLPSQYERLIRQENVTIAIYEESQVEELSKMIENLKRSGKISKEFKQKISILVNTGMNRLGFDLNAIREEDLNNQLIKFTKLNEKIQSLDENLDLFASLTHFSVADDPEKINFTKGQIHRLFTAISKMENPPIVSFANSAGTLSLMDYYPKEYMNQNWKIAFRPGISLWGMPSGYEKLPNELQPVVEKIGSKIAQIRYLKKGETLMTVSYGNTIAQMDGYYATIPIGYGDGIRREYTDPHVFLINGKFCPVIGKVCMDQLVVYLGEEKNCKIGDDAFFVNEKEGWSVVDVAKRLKTITYTITTQLTSRPTRIVKLPKI